MKKVLFFALAAACTLGVAKADEYIDFGKQDEGIAAWKGDFATGDINGDGHLDILFSGEENAWIMLGDGAGGFTKQEACPFTKGLSGDIALGDIDGDGDLDVIFTNWGAGSQGADSRGIALNDGAGNFTVQSREDYPIIESYEVVTYEGEEGMTEVKINTFTSCGFADFNLDGLMDYYFFANYTVGRRNQKDSEGNWVVDENGKNKEEDIPGSGRNNMVIYFQNPDGTFTPDEEFFGLNPDEYKLVEPEVSVIDFDRNGTPDIWMNAANNACDCDNKEQVGENKRFSRLFKNDDGLGFVEFGNEGIAFEKANGNSVWADLDGDGYLDMLHHGDGFLCSGETKDNVYRVYKNLDGIGLEEKFMEEIARDGFMGNGTAWVDWNGDGVLDFFAGGWAGEPDKQVTRLYLGTQGKPFSFTRATGADYDFGGVSEQSYRVADLNGDRRPDLLFCGHGVKENRRTTGWIKNTSGAVVAAPAAPALGEAVVDTEEEETMVILSWTAPETLAGKAGITWNLSLKNKTTGKWLYNPMSDLATGKRLAATMGNVYTNNEYTLYGLPAGEYEWTVQAVDASNFGGAFATAGTFTIATSGVDVVNNYKAEVFVADNMLKVIGVENAAQAVNVYNLSGALVNTASFNGTISMAMPQAGIYMVEVLNAEGGRFHTKVVVK